MAGSCHFAWEPVEYLFFVFFPFYATTTQSCGSHTKLRAAASEKQETAGMTQQRQSQQNTKSRGSRAAPRFRKLFACPTRILVPAPIRLERHAVHVDGLILILSIYPFLLSSHNTLQQTYKERTRKQKFLLFTARAESPVLLVFLCSKFRKDSSPLVSILASLST